VSQAGLFNPVQAFDRLGQRVVLAVATRYDRGLDASLGQTHGAANAEVLRTLSKSWTRVPSRCGLHPDSLCSSASSTNSARIDDESDKDLAEEGDVGEPLPGRHLGEVDQPSLVRALGLELAIEPVQQAWPHGIGRGRANGLAARGAAPAVGPHQPLDSAGRRRDAFAAQLLSGIGGAVDLQFASPDALDLGQKLSVALLPG
jgi:hypothetical protein